MKHSQPQITLYRSVILFSWGGKMLHSVESLIMILLSASLASLSPPSYGGLTKILLSSMNNNCDKSLEPTVSQRYSK